MPRNKSFNEIDTLERAMFLFWRNGYAATSIEDLVIELGLNRASIYNTWGNKHKLYIASLRLYRQKQLSWLLGEVRSEKPAKEVIADFFNTTLAQALGDNETKGCFIVNATTELANLDAEVNMIVEENRLAVEKVLAELIKEGQQVGSISTSSAPNALARFLFSCNHGLKVLSMGKVNAKELQAVVETTLSVLE